MRRLRAALLAIACGAAALFGSLAAPTASADEVPALTVTHVRHSPGVVDSGGVYNYVPSVLFDNGVYRMWWCGSDPAHPGDHVFYAESASLDGPFHAPGSTAPYEVVFSPTGAATFDSVHTCDPTVLRVGTTYYLYYSGWTNQPGQPTEIGVASSPDGLVWTRLNNGRPIIVPAGKQDTGNAYGAGQPTASFYDGRIYLMYTDTTGAAATPKNGNGLAEGAGQFVLRATDPTFQTGVEELTADGFAPETPANHTSYNGVGDFYSVDLQFSDVLQSWIIAHSDGSASRLSFYAPDFSHHTYADVPMPLSVVEGPGLASTPDRHALNGSDCVVPVDIINATTNPTAPTNLEHEGADISDPQSCDQA